LEFRRVLFRSRGCSPTRGRRRWLSVADNAEKTIADVLREAAARLRKIGSKVMPGPWESLNDGDRLVAWRNVPGTDFDDDMEYVFNEPLEKETAEWVALVNSDLAEPLARWLGEA